jgi:GDP-mannose pyrophosphatase NudK
MSQIRILEKKILSENWYRLFKYTFEITDENGKKNLQEREAYDRGNGAVILLFNPENKSVVLTRQFRMPTYVNGNKDGMLIEACAGLLDEDNPEDCIKRETEEETGYRISKVQRIYEAYMSPGSVTEILYFFIGQYSSEQKVNEGGGVDQEENIQVLEIKFDRALEMIRTGEIRDAKTIMLLQYAQIHKLL